MPLEPGAEFGAYRIRGTLGAGGMATVYKAYEPQLDREVAIKVISGELAADPQFRARFTREAQVLARLEHLHILPIYAVGVAEERPFIVYRYIGGGTLARRLGRPLGGAEAIALLRPIADALDFAHSRGIVHRDVKPGNVLLTEAGVPIVADFGLAHLLEAGREGTEHSLALTQAGLTLGTPTYMAPEQVEGAGIDGRADQYALAVVAYQMLTGTVPFTAPTPMGVAARQLRDPLPPPSSRNAALDSEVDAVLSRALAKLPAERFPSCTAFVAALASLPLPVAPPLDEGSLPVEIWDRTTVGEAGGERPATGGSGLYPRPALAASETSDTRATKVTASEAETPVQPRTLLPDTLAAAPFSPPTATALAPADAAPTIVAPTSPHISPALARPDRTPSVSPASPARRRAPWIAAGALVVLTVAGLGLFFATRQGRSGCSACATATSAAKLPTLPASTSPESGVVASPALSSTAQPTASLPASPDLLATALVQGGFGANELPAGFGGPHPILEGISPTLAPPNYRKNVDTSFAQKPVNDAKLEYILFTTDEDARAAYAFELNSWTKSPATLSSEPTGLDVPGECFHLPDDYTFCYVLSDNVVIEGYASINRGQNDDTLQTAAELARDGLLRLRRLHP